MKPDTPALFYTCVVSYENTGEASEFIPENCWGATGLVAVNAENVDELETILRTGLAHLKLRLVEITDIEIIGSADEVEEKDEHLASNIRNWEPDHRWVIGTVHGYFGEGVA